MPFNPRVCSRSRRFQILQWRITRKSGLNKRGDAEFHLEKAIALSLVSFADLYLLSYARRALVLCIYSLKILPGLIIVFFLHQATRKTLQTSKIVTACVLLLLHNFYFREMFRSLRGECNKR